MDNQLPRVIIFQEDEKARNHKYLLPYSLDSDIAVKSIDYELEEFKKNHEIVSQKRIEKNDVLFLHPYKVNVYTLNLDEMYFLKEKLALYRRIGQNLGALSIRTKLIKSETQKIETDINGNVSIKTVKVETDVHIEKNKLHTESIEIEETFEKQHNFDLNKNIEGIKNLIKRYNLNHETEIINLIDARDSKESGTTLTSQKIRSEVSSEYNSLIQVAAQLKSKHIPVFKLSADFERRVEHINKLFLEIEYNFK